MALRLPAGQGDANGDRLGVGKAMLRIWTGAQQATILNAMLRRLLACLALLTGLLALAAPAYAAASTRPSSQVEASGKADSSAPSASANCGERERQGLARGERPAPCRSPRTVTIVIPTVQFGPDRAFE